MAAWKPGRTMGKRHGGNRSHKKRRSSLKPPRGPQPIHPHAAQKDIAAKSERHTGAMTQRFLIHRAASFLRCPASGAAGKELLLLERSDALTAGQASASMPAAGNMAAARSFAPVISPPLIIRIIPLRTGTFYLFSHSFERGPGHAVRDRTNRLSLAASDGCAALLMEAPFRWANRQRRPADWARRKISSEKRSTPNDMQRPRIEI